MSPVSGAPTFETRTVRVRYAGARHRALDGVDLSVERGRLYAVLGPNGSGKSTLMRALLGRAPVEGGQVLVQGRPVEAWSRPELARAVGAMAQAEQITFPLRVGELVAMGRYPYLGRFGTERPSDRAAVRSALVRCDVADLERRDVSTLSGGELQRVRLARALAQQTGALALDEPTASLDVRHEMSILALLRSAADEGTTVLLITHHLDLAARFADRMMLLDGGRVAAEGVPGEVMRAETLTRVYGWPIDVAVDPVTGTPRVTPLDAHAPARPDPASSASSLKAT